VIQWGRAGAAPGAAPRELRGIRPRAQMRIPVMATRRIALLAGPSRRRLCGDQLLDAFAHLADVAHVAHIVVGNADIDSFSRAKRISTASMNRSPTAGIALDRDRWKGDRLEVAITFSTRWINSSDIASALRFKLVARSSNMGKPGAGRASTVTPISGLAQSSRPS